MIKYEKIKKLRRAPHMIFSSNSQSPYFLQWYTQTVIIHIMFINTSFTVYTYTYTILKL